MDFQYYTFPHQNIKFILNTLKKYTKKQSPQLLQITGIPGNNYPCTGLKEELLNNKKAVLRQRGRVKMSHAEGRERKGAEVHCVISPHMIHVVFLSALGVMHHVLCFIFRRRHPSHFAALNLDGEERTDAEALLQLNSKQTQAHLFRFTRRLSSVPALPHESRARDRH